MEPDLKFKRQVFMNNVMRIKAVIMYFVDLANYVESCFEWESPMRSIIAFVAYVVTCYYCQPFWFPIFLLLIFARNYLVISYLGKKPLKTVNTKKEIDVLPFLTSTKKSYLSSGLKKYQTLEVFSLNKTFSPKISLFHTFSYS